MLFAVALVLSFLAVRDGGGPWAPPVAVRVVPAVTVGLLVGLPCRRLFTRRITRAGRSALAAARPGAPVPTTSGAWRRPGGSPGWRWRWAVPRCSRTRCCGTTSCRPRGGGGLDTVRRVVGGLRRVRRGRGLDVVRLLGRRWGLRMRGVLVRRRVVVRREFGLWGLRVRRRGLRQQ
ncbi:hypothetical protein O1L44_06995 [Streptomyces noursei]|nr:hypothetical protein [Streptomyces noursei]